jgi:hypothetical protein
VTETACCAIYARYSSELQNPLTIDQQIRKCREYAERHRLRILDRHIYADEAISGATDDREGLRRLLMRAKEKPPAFSVILVDDTSRLSRKLVDSLRIFEQLQFAGIRVIFVAQGHKQRAGRAPRRSARHRRFAVPEGSQQLAQKLASSDPSKVRLQLRDMRKFVEARLKSLRSMLTGEARLVRAEIAKHVQKITLTPEGRAYVASGGWDLLGSVGIACNSHTFAENSGACGDLAVRVVPGARLVHSSPQTEFRIEVAA